MPATPESVAALRTAVGAFAMRGGVPEPPLEDVKLAVSEAITNAVIHGYRNAAHPGSVEVSAALEADELRLVVIDEGSGMQPRGDSPGGGFGLPLIAAVADGCEIREHDPHGTELHLMFRLAL